MYTDVLDLNHRLALGFTPHSSSTVRPPLRILPPSSRSILDLGRNARFDLAIFQHLRSLYLTEILFDPNLMGSPLPPLPFLKTLTIYTFRAHSHMAKRCVSGFVCPGIGTGPFESGQLTPEGWDDYSYTAPHHVLECPALKTLIIAARIPETPETPRPALEPRAVLQFVREYVHYGAPARRLAQLELVGVRMHVIESADGVQALQDMLDLAVDTQFDNRFLYRKFIAPDMLSWH
jgi:hypothetical protein